MNLQDFQYELPPDRIAQYPAEPRDASRLLVVQRSNTCFVDARFLDLPDFLDHGDLLVVNDTRVVPARVVGRKPTGGRVEFLLLRPEASGVWESLAGASKPLKPGAEVRVPGGVIRVEEVLGGGRYRVRLDVGEDPDAWVERHGQVPLPPYIRREAPDPRDRTWYQTVFARRDRAGSAAAPTAGLHFTQRVLDALARRGVEIVAVTLHVGLGTFQPVRVERVEDHRMHSEWYCVTPDAAARVNRALEEGRRVVAVGTTVTRVLEHTGRTGRVEPGTGWTDLFILPGHRFRIVSALLTNFHLPGSTLLMLVCAFGGRERILAAYRHAVATGYRFYSYGDAMLVL